MTTTSATLERSFPPLNLAHEWSYPSRGPHYVGTVPFSSKFYPRVAQKSYAPLEWPFPSPDLSLASVTKGMLSWNGCIP